MATYITIDGGTTNTRISLVCDGCIKQTLKINIGAQKSIEGTKPLRQALKDAIASLLTANSLAEQDVCRILASGMITSEFGLCKLDHIAVPAGLCELSNATHEVVLEDISSIPFVFVRGVKSVSQDIGGTDMMRGEETELMGIIEPSHGECIYVLPGSHSKIIRCDDRGRITAFSTLLTGEMLFALSQNTILKDAVDFSIDECDTDFLLQGYHYAETKGISEGLFKVRVLKNLFGTNPAEVYSFYMGVVLQPEIKRIAEYGIPKVIIGGKKQLRSAMYAILSEVSSMNVISLKDEDVEISVPRGLIRIYENKMHSV